MSRILPIIATCLILLLGACVSSDAPDNPFAGNQPSESGNGNGVDTLDPQSFAGLHQQIFKPTCANSGCHDGTFEPDFRSIESSYNTLVWHPIIKNDPQGSYEHRVVPGKPEESVLWIRLTQDIDGQSGIMPLSVDPNSDWRDRKETHLANLKAWIEGGAEDMFGNPAGSGNLQPSVLGVVARVGGNTLARDGGSGPILVPAGAENLEIWFSLQDDQLGPTQLPDPEIRFSKNLNDFSGISPLTAIQAGPITEEGLLGDPVTYHHRVVVNAGQWLPDQTIFFRIYLKDDPQGPVTEVPADGSLNYMKTYFAFRRQ